MNIAVALEGNNYLLLIGSISSFILFVTIMQDHMNNFYSYLHLLSLDSSVYND